VRASFGIEKASVWVFSMSRYKAGGLLNKRTVSQTAHQVGGLTEALIGRRGMGGSEQLVHVVI
jgi:hypothetical protein